LNLLNNGVDPQAISPNAMGEFHQTLTLHSQSQKNALGVGNHPDSAMENIANRNNQ
jgi:hypothetical protein